ncbi:hypothetical protein NDU88_005831 [Pleurodeles waltl]|uniref:Uncharacterized protein n=1 Tax=Pleurodeles waltl TaxID=8319 RepID=A0AAV7RPH8_PLEWA|nr:hypothetical protein NDU88_005831 [Pleurodeles waltl]
MWITKTGQSQDFYDPEDLRFYLDDLTPKSMETTPQTLPADVPQNSLDAMLLPTSSDVRSLRDRGIPQRGRDQTKYSRLNNDRQLRGATESPVREHHPWFLLEGTAHSQSLLLYVYRCVHASLRGVVYPVHSFIV